MKKSLFLIIAFSLVAFMACKEEESVDAPITKISFGWVPEDDATIAEYKIDKSGIFVGVNNSRITVVHQEPFYATRANVSYSSKNPKIVTISADGTITGIGKGVTYIYATAKNALDSANLLIDSCKIFVDTIPLTALSAKIKSKSFNDYYEKTLDKEGKDSIIRENPGTLFLNDIAVMSINSEPNNASFNDVVWTSSDPSVLKVSGDTITAVGNGNAQIMGKLKYKHFDKFDVTYNWKVEERAMDNIMFASPSKKIVAGTNESVEILFIPTYTSLKDVAFESSNPELVNIVQGRVYAYGKSGDEAILTVRSTIYKNGQGDYLSSTCKFKIK